MNEKNSHWLSPISFADDILWFKPVELRTKWGRRGHIKEALGNKIVFYYIFDL